MNDFNDNLGVLYDGRIFVQQPYGGVSRLFFQLVRHLLERRDTRILMFQGFHINRFPFARFKNDMAFYFGKRIPRPPYTAKMIRIFNSLLFDLFKPRKAVDVFHPTEYSYSAARWNRSPMVLTVYDMIYELFPQYFRDMRPWVEAKRRCIQRADAIITISESTRKDLLEYYQLDSRKVTVVYPGGPDPVDLDAEPNTLPHHRPFILYVGTRKRGYKNFKNFLLAFAGNPRINAEFDLVCFGGGGFTREERRVMGRLGCAKKVFQVEGDDALLDMLYRGARAFVYPSLYEGFGLPPLEAMARGCPVAAGGVSSIPEVLEDAAFYFDPHCPGSIGLSLERLLFDDHQIKNLVELGLEQVKKFSWGDMADNTRRVYAAATGTGS